jgi:sugar lactone lactonase YvrE
VQEAIMHEVSLALDARAQLGECPRWSAPDQALYFVDIAAQTLNRFDPATGARQSRRFEAPVGCFVLRRSGGFVLAMADGFALLDAFESQPQPIGPPVEAGRPSIRFNDGRTDFQGRFWAGTLDGTKTDHAAAVYRLDTDGRVVRVLDGALTCNGIAVSPDQSRLYFSDTPSHQISVFDFDPEDGRISNRRTFHAFPKGQGRPDGASVDAEGFYWCALYAGGRVVRLSPEGQIVAEVAIPAINVTMIGFGGPDLRTAYVTTARQNATADDLARYPHAGGVFTFRVETPGLPETPFAG